MKLISLQKNLKTSLYSVSHVAQKNTNLPILNNVLLSAQNGIIKLIGTNLEIGITNTLRGKIEAEGSFTVDARVFSEYVNLLPNDKVEISLEENDLFIVCGDNKTKIRGMSAEEFPFIPEVDQSELYRLPINEFKKAASQVVFAAAVDENRAELSGIFCVLEDNTITLVGTDSYRLAERIIPIKEKYEIKKSCIIPTRTIQEVLRILGSETSENPELEEITLSVTENQCLFVIGNTEIVSRLISGRYPDYKQIIPNHHESRIIINREELNRVVKTATLFSKLGSNDILFESDGNKKNLTISSTSGQIGEHKSILSGNITGSNIAITLNARYVLDVLTVLNEDEIIIDLVNESTPCVIRSKEDTNYLYIIMPIKN